MGKRWKQEICIIDEPPTNQMLDNPSFFLIFSLMVRLLHVRYLPERAAVGPRKHLLREEEEALW